MRTVCTCIPRKSPNHYRATVYPVGALVRARWSRTALAPRRLRCLSRHVKGEVRNFYSKIYGDRSKGTPERWDPAPFSREGGMGSACAPASRAEGGLAPIRAGAPRRRHCSDCNPSSRRRRRVILHARRSSSSACATKRIAPISPWASMWAKKDFSGETDANQAVKQHRWRMGRDSNPRDDSSPSTHFPGVRLQPLGHPSPGGAALVGKRRAGRARRLAEASGGSNRPRLVLLCRESQRARGPHRMSPGP
jgi:hypothetical protein